MKTVRFFLAEGVAAAYRPVSASDENRLTDEESASLIGCVIDVRRRAAAARVAARTLLAEVGWPAWSMPRRVGCGPSWPKGIVGSLSHCDQYAAAAVASRSAYAGIGIDIEPAEPLEAAVLNLVAAPEEVAAFGGELLYGRILFCAKEAAYKAVYPLDQCFFEPREVVVDIESRVATLPNNRNVQLNLCVGRRIVALGTVRA